MSGDMRGPCGDLAGTIATEGRGTGTGVGGHAAWHREAEMAGDRPKHRSAAFMSEQPCLISGKGKRSGGKRERERERWRRREEATKTEAVNN